MAYYPGKDKSTASNASFAGGGLERQNQADTNIQDRQTNLTDVTVCIIQCKKHETYAFQATTGEEGSSFFFPFGSTIQEKEAIFAGTTKLKQLLAHPKGPHGYAPFKPVELVQTFVTKAPVSKKTLTRYTYYTYFTTPLCCTSFSLLNWIKLSEVKTFSLKFWGPECWQYLSWFESGSTVSDAVAVPSGSGSGSVGRSDYKKQTELSIDKYMSLLNSDKMVMHVVLKGLSVDENTFRLFFNDFCQCIWPSKEMSLHSFTEWSVSIGFLKSDQEHKKMESVFRAFCYDRSALGMNTINFTEFISGLALMDPTLPIQNPVIQEARINFIFRYYSKDGENMSSEDYMHLMVDTKAYKPDDVIPSLKKLWADNGITGKGMPRAQFVRLAAKLAIRGTSVLLKSGFEMRKNKRFIHFYQSLPSAVDIRSAKSEGSEKLKKEGISLGKFFTNLIKDFVDHNKIMQTKMSKKAQYVNYLKIPKNEMIGSIVNLCDRVEAIFKGEDRMIRVKSPTCVFGDLHGNIHDLMAYDRMFFTSKVAGNYTMLFLGDYVDRGAFSLEICLYLFALKVLEPNKYFLLRGNHEVRVVNRGFTFYTEIMSKFPQAADFLWERFNKVFDYLPICALVDNTTFCAHGGIPSSKGGVSKFEDLLKIPSPLGDPEKNPLAWEMLWNDPIDHEMFGELMDATRQISGRVFTHDLFDNGFVTNTKRGTAMFWSLQACERFIQENKIKRVVRAHEVCMDGFQTLHNNLTWTVFSSSHYGGSNNKAGVIMIIGDKFKPLKLELDIM